MPTSLTLSGTPNRVSPVSRISLCQSAPLVGSVIASKYEVLDYIGAGATGWVLRVRDQDFDKTDAALKLLYPHLVVDAESKQRFFNEVLITRQLSHHNIVQTYSCGETVDGMYYITMEYVDGRILTHSLDRPQDDLNTILQILLEISIGMKFAHEKGVIHRDLKPENIMFSKSGTTKLLDFGISELINNASNRAVTTLVGTPYYMSPEQFMGKNANRSSDIYSFGILGYELLYGQKPFNGKSFFDLAQQHINTPLPDNFRDIHPHPNWIWQLLVACTAKTPESRPQTFEIIRDTILENYSYDLTSEETRSEPLVVKYTSNEDLVRRKKLATIERNRTGKRIVFVLSFLFFLSWQATSLRGLGIGSILSLLALPIFLNPKRGKSLLLLLAGITFLTIVVQTNEASYKRVAAKVLQFERWSNISLAPLHTLFSIRVEVRSDNDLLEIAADANSDLNREEIWSIIDSGLDLNRTDSQGRTALMLASQNNNSALAGMLLRHGADANKRDPQGESAVYYAIRNDSLQVILVFIHDERDLDIKNNNGLNPLTVALQNSRIPIIELLLPAVPSITEVDPKSGDSALHISVRREFYSISEQLLEKGIDPNVQNKEFQTPLHLAVLASPTSQTYVKHLKTLLSHGAQTQIKDLRNLTPLDYAKQLDRAAAIKVLEGYNA